MKMRLMLPSALALTVSAGLAAAQPGFIQQCGTASWYALTSQTANGETANPDALTAAHRSLPFGTTIRVENLQNGRALKLRVNDRGPFVGGRIIDVSRAAADRLGFKHQGTVRVRVTIADRGDGERLLVRRGGQHAIDDAWSFGIFFDGNSTPGPYKQTTSARAGAGGLKDKDPFSLRSCFGAQYDAKV